MSDTIQFRNLSFVARSADLTEDQFSAAFQDLKSIPIPEELENQVININQESIDNSLLLFTDHLLRSDDSVGMRRGNVNLIVFDVEDGAIEMSGDIDPSLIDSFVNTFDNTLSIVGTWHVIDYRVDFNIDEIFENLSVNISGPSDFDYQGVRFTHENFNYIVQSQFAHRIEERDAREDVSEFDQEDKKTTRASVRQIEHFDVTDPNQFTTGFIEQSKAALSSLLP